MMFYLLATALCTAATSAVPSNSTFLRADAEQIRYLGRVDLSAPPTARMAWVMTGASASFTLAGPPVPGAVPAAGTYACENNKNYEGETTCFTDACPAENVATVEACEALCDNEVGCTVLVWGSAKKECYLKSDYTKSKNDPTKDGTISCKKAVDPNRANLVLHVAGPKDGARLRVEVDGVAIGLVSIPKKAAMAAYAVGLPALASGNHTVVMRKITEDNGDNVDDDNVQGMGMGMGGKAAYLTFAGFEITGNNKQLFTWGQRPQPAARRLEFIGDSDTAGWCADGSPQTNDNPDSYQDAWDTWAQQIARNVSADVMVEAVSGFGVTKKSSPIQAILDYTLGFDKDKTWDYSQWIPDAVVILIGPNDEVPLSAAGGNVTKWNELKSSKFIASYLQLMEMVATNYKGAATPPKMVHVCGGSLNGLDPCDDIKTANNQFNSGSGTNGIKGYFTSITTQHWDLINGKGGNGKSGKTPYNGCDGHYNIKGHGILAGDIIPQFKKIMGW